MRTGSAPYNAFQTSALLLESAKRDRGIGAPKTEATEDSFKLERPRGLAGCRPPEISSFLRSAAGTNIRSL
jgi:hypothetical protein